VGTGDYSSPTQPANNPISNAINSTISTIKDYVAKTYNSYVENAQKDAKLNTSIVDPNKFSFKSDTDATGPGITSTSQLSTEAKEALVALQDKVGLPLSVSLRTTSPTEQTLSVSIDTAKAKTQGKVATDVDKVNFPANAAQVGFSGVKGTLNGTVTGSITASSVSKANGTPSPAPSGSSASGGTNTSSGNTNTGNNPGNPSASGYQGDTSGPSKSGGTTGGSPNTGNNPGNANASGYQGNMAGTPNSGGNSASGNSGSTNTGNNPGNANASGYQGGGYQGSNPVGKGDRVGTGAFGSSAQAPTQNTSPAPAPSVQNNTPTPTMFGGVPATSVKTTSYPPSKNVTYATDVRAPGTPAATPSTPSTPSVSPAAPTTASTPSVAPASPATPAAPTNPTRTTSISADQNAELSFNTPTTPRSTGGVFGNLLGGKSSSSGGSSGSNPSTPAPSLVGGSSGSSNNPSSAQHEGGSNNRQNYSTSTTAERHVGVFCNWFGWFCPAVAPNNTLIQTNSSPQLLEI
jgi:hypothetical protein